MMKVSNLTTLPPLNRTGPRKMEGKMGRMVEKKLSQLALQRCPSAGRDEALKGKLGKCFYRKHDLPYKLDHNRSIMYYSSRDLSSSVVKTKNRNSEFTADLGRSV